jgi:hypothetical protein
MKMCDPKFAPARERPGVEKAEHIFEELCSEKMFSLYRSCKIRLPVGSSTNSPSNTQTAAAVNSVSSSGNGMTILWIVIGILIIVIVVLLIFKKNKRSL